MNSPAALNSRLLGNNDVSVRVLVVEDNPDDQELLLRQLRKANIHENILFINDGQKALDLLQKPRWVDKICAVFLDLQIPGLSGIKFLSALRKKAATAHLPVIIMTGSNSVKDREQCEQLNVSTFIAKPISFHAFCIAIANVFHLPRQPSLTRD